MWRVGTEENRVRCRKKFIVKYRGLYCIRWESLYMNSSESWTWLGWAALPGAGPVLGKPASSLDWRILLQKVEERRRLFSLRYMYRITLQNVLLWNGDKYVFRHQQYCSYVTCNCQCNFHCLWTNFSLCTKDNCSKNTKLQRACAALRFTLQ